jgi:site-specific recombinase XerD
MGQLYDQMKMDLELKGYSEKTRQCYLARMVQFAGHFQRSPAELGTEEIRTYLHSLLMERGLSQSYINQAYSALKFFYVTTLGRGWDVRRIPRSKRTQRLPVVLSEEELSALFSVTRNVKHRALLVTLYSAGLRVSEGTQLQVSDIDSDRMTIRVRAGKGGKDRYTVLAQRTLELLREYWRWARPRDWLFPGQPATQPLSSRSVQKVLTRSREQAGITKAITVHSLRHSFATHLIESGVDIYHLQRLLGHTTVKTTARYVHLTPHELARVVSPLDRWASFELPPL